MDAEHYRVRDFLTRTAQPYEWHEAGSAEADVPDGAPASPTAGAGSTPNSGYAGLSARVAVLEAEVTVLRDALRRLAAAVGEPDPLERKDEGETAGPSAGPA